MVTLRGNTPRAMRLREENGVVQSYTTERYVRGITARDGTALQQALDAAGVPQYGDVSADYPNLVLRAREVTLETRDLARVLLEYGPRGDVVVDQYPYALMEGAVSIQQVEASNDRFGNTVVVAHRFLSTDLRKDEKGNPIAGRIVPQTAKLQVMIPQIVLRNSRKIFTDYPHHEAKRWAAHVNSVEWQGEPPRHWLCIGCVPEPLELSATSDTAYLFHFEWQLNEDGWDEPYVFIDPDNNKQPVSYQTDDGEESAAGELFPGGVQDGRTYPGAVAYPEMYAEVDFNELFPS